MSKNDMKLAITGIGALAHIDGDNVMEQLTKWNKEKIYPLSPIHIKVGADGVEDNSEEIGKLVSLLETFVNDVEKNALDLIEVEEAKKSVAEFGKYLVETRKIQTAPLTKVTGNYTQHENKFKDFSEALSAKIDAIKEKDYQKAEVAIKEYFTELLEEQEITEVIGLDMFTDFIENKRKTKFFTTKGALNKSIKDAITEAIRVAHEPIKQMQEFEERKTLQSKQFEAYLVNFEVEGETEKLEAEINQLIRFKESVETLYPDISEHCYRSIDNKIGHIQGNIRGNKAIAEKDAIKNADGELMERFNAINMASQDLTADIETLKSYHKELSDIYHDFKFAENREKVKALGVSIKQRITELEVEELSPKVEKQPPVSVQPVAEAIEVKEDSAEMEEYFISIHDIEFLSSVGMDAINEEDAKAKFVKMFESHLSMVQLIKGN